MNPPFDCDVANTYIEERATVLDPHFPGLGDILRAAWKDMASTIIRTSAALVGGLSGATNELDYYTPGATK